MLEITGSDRDFIVIFLGIYTALLVIVDLLLISHCRSKMSEKVPPQLVKEIMMTYPKKDRGIFLAFFFSCVFLVLAWIALLKWPGGSYSGVFLVIACFIGFVGFLHHVVMGIAKRFWLFSDRVTQLNKLHRAVVGLGEVYSGRQYLTVSYSAPNSGGKEKLINFILPQDVRERYSSLIKRGGGNIIVLFEGLGLEEKFVAFEERVIRYVAPVDSGEK